MQFFKVCDLNCIWIFESNFETSNRLDSDQEGRKYDVFFHKEYVLQIENWDIEPNI